MIGLLMSPGFVTNSAYLRGVPIALLAAFLKYLLRIHGAALGATFLEKKRQQLMQNLSVCRIPETTMLSLNSGQTDIFELLEVM